MSYDNCGCGDAHPEILLKAATQLENGKATDKNTTSYDTAVADLRGWADTPITGVSVAQSYALDAYMKFLTAFFGTTPYDKYG